eukprot:scaffold150177_cov52-Prasinocladus_malaysianus.AAC.2
MDRRDWKTQTQIGLIRTCATSTESEPHEVQHKYPRKLEQLDALCGVHGLAGPLSPIAANGLRARVEVQSILYAIHPLGVYV